MEWEIFLLLASLAQCWDMGIFSRGDMVCHLQPRIWVQLSFWSHVILVVSPLCAVVSHLQSAGIGLILSCAQVPQSVSVDGKKHVGKISPLLDLGLASQCRWWL